MKHLSASAIVLSLSLSLLGCKKTETVVPAPADPFVGHWVAESRRDVTLTTTGQTIHDDTVTGTFLLDATASSYSITYYSGPNSTGSFSPGTTYAYTRAGEYLTIPGQGAAETIQLRGLSESGFTYVRTTPRAGNGPAVQTFVYHR